MREFEDILAGQMAKLGPNHPETLITRHDLAFFRIRNDDQASQAEISAELRDLRKTRRQVLGPNHPYTLLTHSLLSQWLTIRSDGDEQVREYEGILTEQLSELGPDHPETLITRHDLAIARKNSGQAQDAEVEAELRDILMASHRQLGPKDPYVLLIHGTLAHLIKERSHDENSGDAEYRAMIEHIESRAPDGHRFLPLHQRHNMAHALDAAERWTEAEAEYRSVLSDLAGAGGQDLDLYWNLTRCLTDNLVKQNRQSDAVTLLDECLTWFDGSDDMRSPRRPHALRLRHRRGDLMHRYGRYEEAEQEIRAVLSDRLRTVDQQDSVVLSERHCLAHTLDALERHSEAQGELRQVVESYIEILGIENKQTRNASFCLARMLHSHGDKAKGLQIYQQVLTVETAEFGANHSETLMTRFRRDQCRLEMGLLSPAEAVTAFRDALSALIIQLGDEHRWVAVINEALTDANESANPK